MVTLAPIEFNRYENNDWNKLLSDCEIIYNAYDYDKLRTLHRKYGSFYNAKRYNINDKIFESALVAQIILHIEYNCKIKIRIKYTMYVSLYNYLHRLTHNSNTTIILDHINVNINHILLKTHVYVAKYNYKFDEYVCVFLENWDIFLIMKMYGVDINKLRSSVMVDDQLEGVGDPPGYDRSSDHSEIMISEDEYPGPSIVQWYVYNAYMNTRLKQPICSDVEYYNIAYVESGIIKKSILSDFAKAKYKTKSFKYVYKEYKYKVQNMLHYYQDPYLDERLDYILTLNNHKIMINYFFY